MKGRNVNLLIRRFYSLRQCIISPHREIRIMGLRALRLLVEGPDDVEIMMVHQLDIFSARYNIDSNYSIIMLITYITEL